MTGEAPARGGTRHVTLPSWSSRSRRDLLVAVGCCWVVFLGGLVVFPPARVVGGVAVGLVLPGLVALRAMGARQRGPSSIPYAVGLSMVVLIAVVMVVAAAPTGADPTSVVVGIGLVTTVLAAMVPTGGRRPPSGHVIVVPPPGRLVAVIAAAAVTVVALVLAVAVTVRSARDVAVDPRTAVTLLPVEGAVAEDPFGLPFVTDYLLGVVNREGSTERYEIEITVPGTASVTETIDLEDGERWERTVVRDQRGVVTVRVYGGTSGSHGYREVTVGSR